MKLHIVLLLLVVSSLRCNSSANSSASNSLNPDSVVVSINGNMLFIGYPSEINIGFNVCIEGETVVKTDSCSRYYHGNPDSYWEKDKTYLEALHPYLTTIWIGKAIGKDTVWIASKKIRVRRYPMPSVHLGALENNGLPVPKEALLAQSGLFFPGLGMCGPPYSHQVISFRLTVIGLDVQSYCSDSYAFTPIMRGAILRCSPGATISVDQIVAEDLKDGFKAPANNLAHPILRKSPFEDSQNILFANWEFTDSSEMRYQKLGVTSLEEIINAHHSVYSGKIRMWMGDSAKVYQFEKIYKDGEIIERRKINQDGKVIYELIKIAPKKWQLLFYYPSGQIKFKATSTDNLDYFGTELYKKNTHIRYEQLDTISFDSMIKDSEFLVHQLPLYNRELVPIGQFDAYHENGVKSVSGFLSIKNPSPILVPICTGYLAPLDTYSQQSAFDGLWVFYNKKGKPIATRKYKMGIQID